MSQTILIHDNEDLKKLYSLNLKTYAGTDIVERGNAADAISLLAILPSIDLIITTNSIENEQTAVVLHKYLKENELEIPLIVLGDCPAISQDTLCLKSPADWEVLIKHAAKLLGITEEDVQKKVKPNHVPIALRYFYEIDHTPCDVYIRIKKGTGDFDYVKRLYAQDSFDSNDIDKYEAQGLKDFYIPKDYQQYFVNFVTNSLIQKLEISSLDIEDRLNVNSVGYDLVADHIENFGIDEGIQDLAKGSIKSMIATTKQAPKLASLLKMLLSSKISYAYQHAHLVCVIGNFILSKQQWYKEKHLEIFATAAFFSDITLKSPEQIRINSDDDAKASKLEQAELDHVNTHAADAAQLIVGTPLYTEYLFAVIQQHQGSMDGIGFPEDPTEDIHPIARVFIVADYFVKLMLDPKAPKNKKDILSIIYARFTQDSYHKITKVLELKIN